MGRTNGPLGRTQRTVGASQRRVRRRFAPPNGPLVRPNGVGRGHDEGPNGVGACSTASRRAVDGVEVDPQRRRGVHRGLPNGVGSISRRHVDDPSTPLGSCPRHPQRRRDVVQVTPNAVGSHPQRRLEAVCGFLDAVEGPANGVEGQPDWWVSGGRNRLCRHRGWTRWAARASDATARRREVLHLPPASV